MKVFLFFNLPVKYDLGICWCKVGELKRSLDLLLMT